MFEKYYQAPFWADSYEMYAFSKDNKMSFNFLEGCDGKNAKLKPKDIIDILNSKKESTETGFFYDKESQMIKNITGGRFLLIRGWGMLTGIGGYNLPAEKAAKIQDEFAEWIVSRLNGGK